jgi:predicted nuclease of predicted toxin-antitoxin system
MPRYLIDTNLPYYFSLWNNQDYIHQNDINPLWPDKAIWDYAINHGLTIVTKDSDFSDRILLKKPPPHIIHIRIGNVSMTEFHAIISKNWSTIIEMSNTFKLVIVFKDRIESIE